MKISDDVYARVEKITRDLIDKGLLIEGGFAALVMQTKKELFKSARDEREAMELMRLFRLVYLAGAQHLFGSMTGAGVLDQGGGDEPTAAEMERMGKIDAELRACYPELVRFGLNVKRPQ